MASEETEMTENEKLILEIDPLHPAFMIRPDISKIRVAQRSTDDVIPTQDITFHASGTIKSMLHMKMGWIALPPGNTPSMAIDRITEYKQDGSNSLSSETRDLKTDELLRNEEYRFEFNGLKSTKTHLFINSGLSVKMSRESNYYYDRKGFLVKIETQISKDSSVISNSVLALDREQNGLIRMKKIYQAKENGELEDISKTTYNYDSENRLKNSITSEKKKVISKEYQYQNRDYPQHLSLITEKNSADAISTIRYEYNNRGDRWRTTLMTEDVTKITEYEYEYAT